MFHNIIFFIVFLLFNLTNFFRRKRIENFRLFDDVLNNHCFDRTSGSKEDYLAGSCVTANCPLEYCNELVPGTQQYVLKRQRQLLVNGKCVSKNNGKTHKCNSIAQTRKVRDDLANTCSGTDYCHEFRNKTWEKDLYRKHLNDDGVCEWKNISTNDTQTQEYLNGCLKDKFSCFQHNSNCEDGRKMRFVLDDSDSTGMTCKEANTCEDCEPVTITCNNVKYVQSLRYGICNFFDKFDRPIPDDCDGIQYNVNCKSSFVCNGETYNPTINKKHGTCVYESLNGNKMYTDNCIPHKNCGDSKFFDLESKECMYCTGEYVLTNPKGNSFQDACEKKRNCSGLSDICYEVQNGTYIPKTYAHKYDYQQKRCMSSRPNNCMSSKPVTKPINNESPEKQTPAAIQNPSSQQHNATHVKCRRGFKEIFHRGKYKCVWGSR